ncbi:MAG: DNA polymerase [Bacilli bacterium]
MFVLNGFRKKRNYNLKSTEYFVADFETSSTDETDSEVFVYATGLMNVNDKRNILYYNNNIEDFVKDLYRLEASTNIIYFHNLTFDIEFLLNYLINKQGFKQVLNTYEENEEGQTIKAEKRDLKQSKTFELVYANGTFYQVILNLYYDKFVDCHKKEKVCMKQIIFKDSYKIASFPLVKIAKDFLGITIPKDGINHKFIRRRNYILNAEEMKYLYDDVKILKDFINLILIQGIEVNQDYKVIIDKMTIASQSLHEFKHLMFKSFNDESYVSCEAFNECFPNAEIKGNKESAKNLNNLFESVFPQVSLTVDSFIRKSYFGGIVYKNGDLIDTLTGDVAGLVYDVNSLYPSVMRTRLLPYGEPIFFDGNYKDTDIDKKEYPLYFQEIKVKKFHVKHGFIPNIQIRGSHNFNGTVYAKNNKYLDFDDVEKYEECSFVFSNVQLEYFLKSYDIEGIEYIRGLAFKGSYGIFDRYIDTFMEMKKRGKGAIRATAKLFLNSLYGKFGMNPIKEEKIIDYQDYTFSTISTDNDGNKLDYLDKGVFIAMASFITSYAREVLLTSIEKVYDRFLYCDTDSIHITGYDIPNITIHDKNLGAWKCEGKFTKSKYIGAKRYAEFIDNKWDIKCCGLSRDIMEKLDMEVFQCCEYTPKEIKKNIDKLYTKDDIFYYKDKECTIKVKGLVRSKKKKYVKGGIVIKEQPYMINDKIILVR